VTIKVLRKSRHGTGEEHVSSVELERKEFQSRATQVPFSSPAQFAERAQTYTIALVV
jgi:hypothetical protein